MSERLNEYFTQEAGEYLDQLAALLSDPGIPEPQQLLRLAHGVRGSAQMAGAETIAGVAERLEDAARSVVSNNVIWSEEVRRLAADTVRDLQILIRALNRWGPSEEARVRTAIDRWHELEPEDAVPIESLFYDDDGPHVLSAGDGEDAVVPVESLLLRGDEALREALRLRPELERALAGSEARELLEELFDLVRLGMGAERSGA